MHLLNGAHLTARSRMSFAPAAPETKRRWSRTDRDGPDLISPRAGRAPNPRLPGAAGLIGIGIPASAGSGGFEAG